MNPFVKDFLKVLAAAADEEMPSEGMVRLVVKDVPYWLLGKLDQYLHGEPVSLDSGVTLPVILIDEKSVTSLEDPSSPSSGRYNLDRVTEIRNHYNNSWVAICASGSELNASNLDTTSDLGHVLDGVLQHSLERLFPTDVGVRNDLLRLWHRAVKKNQLPESSSTNDFGWSLAARIACVDPSENILDSVIASLGYAKCEGVDLPEARYQKILEIVSTLAEREGLGALFQRLVLKALETPELGAEVGKALEDCLKHLRSSVVDGASWATRQNFGYAPRESLDELPEWWSTLDFATWELLLRGTGPDGPRKRTLEVVGGIQISDQKPWILLVNPSDNYARVLEDDVEIECEWLISEAGGSFSSLDVFSERLVIGDACPNQTGAFRLRASSGEGLLTSKNLISLWSHELGVFADVIGASSVALPTRVDGEDLQYESAIELSQEGTYTCILHLADGLVVSKVVGRDISPDLEGVDSEIKFALGRGKYRDKITFQLQSDESSTYEIHVSSSQPASHVGILRLEVSAGTESSGVSLSEFDALVASHVERKHAGRSVSASRNDSSVFSRLGGWVLDEEESWFPASLVAGHSLPAVLVGGWRRSSPLNAEGFERDIRPAREISPPSELLSNRSVLREMIREAAIETGGVIEVARLWELAADPEFAECLAKYCETYGQWLKEDDTATWFDTITVHLPSAHHPKNAAMAPRVLLLSPMHPMRLRWQVDAQVVLAGARDSSNFCYLASDLDPDSCPPYWELRYEGDRHGFVLTHGLSNYWSVMVSSRSLMHSEDDSASFDQLGLELPGPTRTLAGGQAYGMLSEVRDLLPAVSRLFVSLKGSVNASDRLFDGIISWFSDQALQPDLASSSHGPAQDWMHAIPLELDIYDQTMGSAAPSSAPLASVAESSSGSLNWYNVETELPGMRQPDLAIHTSLNIVDQQLRSEGAGAASTPGLEMSVFPVWVTGKGLVRTPVTYRQSPKPCFNHDMADYICGRGGQFLETSFQDQQFSSAANLEGFPATGMDPAMVAHLLGDGDSHVWRYARQGAGDDGYFVIAKSGEVIRDNMCSHLKPLDPGLGLSQGEIDDLLSEFGKRGLDSLHAAIGGGVAAAGAIGLLVTSKLLQPFEGRHGIFPDNGPQANSINVIVPLDSFEQKLVGIARSLKMGTAVPRPDFLAISVLDNGEEGPLSIKFTPVEAKCFSSTMTVSQRRQVLDQQCRGFCAFLTGLFEPGVDSQEAGKLWSLGRRKFVAEMFLSGIHIRTHSRDGSWNSLEGRNRAMEICSRLMTWDPRIDIDSYGRLVIVDGSADTCFKHHDTTVDTAGFRETLQVSRSDAAALLIGQGDFKLAIPGDDWDLTLNSPIDIKDDEPGTVVPRERLEELGPSADPVDGETGGSEDVSEIQVEPDSEKDDITPQVGDGIEMVDAPKVDLPRILLGADSSSSPITWEPFKPDDRLPNGHCVIVGQSGSGKTYTIAQIMAPQVIKSGAKIFALEFNDEFEGSSILDTDGAQRINAAHGMEFNPLVISQEEGADYLNVTSHVYALADVLDTTFSLGVQQVSKLRNAIKNLYLTYGIDTVANFEPSKVTVWPEFTDLRDAVEDLPGTAQLLGRIEVLFDTKVFRGREGTMKDLLKATTIVSLKDLPGLGVQHAVSALLLRGVYSTLASMGQISNQIRNVIIVDEAHKVANSPPIEMLIKEIRKFGGAVWLSSQEPTDFRDSVWANCASFLCLRVEDVQQARLCSQKLDNNYELVEQLRELTVGDGYIRNNHYLPFRRIKLTGE